MTQETPAPRISILIPSYNHEQFVAHAVRGALDQTVTDVEVVVVDGSSDGSPQVIETFLEDPRVRLVLIRNQGVSHTFNTCVREARGHYVAFCPSDDVWRRNHMELALDRLRSEPAVDLTYAGAQIINGKNEVTHPGSLLFGDAHPEGNLLEPLLVGNFVPFQSVVMERALFDRFGYFDETIQNTQDFDFWLRIAPEVRFGYVEEPTVLVRWHGGNVSTPGREHDTEVLEEKLRSLYKIADLHASYLHEHGLAKRVRSVIASTHRRLASRTRSRRQAVGEYARALVMQPWKLDLAARLVRTAITGPSGKGP